MGIGSWQLLNNLMHTCIRVHCYVIVILTILVRSHKFLQHYWHLDSTICKRPFFCLVTRRQAIINVYGEYISLVLVDLYRQLTSTHSKVGTRQTAECPPRRIRQAQRMNIPCLFPS